jgi:hypothetical protein
MSSPIFTNASARRDRVRPRAGTITISAAIMAHPARSEQVEGLQAKLDREVPVIWDQIQDRWDTGRRSMLAADPACTHHAVIQDDILIPNDLLAGIERALAYIPEAAPLVGYVGRVRPERDKVKDLVAVANQRDASFITMTRIHWGPLIVVPTSHVCAMIEFCDPLVGILNYDLRLSRYWEEAGIRSYYAWPCLVDHADGPSLVEGRCGVDRVHSRRPSRVAHSFVGENNSALDIDWTGPIIKGR